MTGVLGEIMVVLLWWLHWLPGPGDKPDHDGVKARMSGFMIVSGDTFGYTTFRQTGVFVQSNRAVQGCSTKQDSLSANQEPTCFKESFIQMFASSVFASSQKPIQRAHLLALLTQRLRIISGVVVCQSSADGDLNKAKYLRCTAVFTQKAALRLLKRRDGTWHVDGVGVSQVFPLSI